jgi:hypothetical protein
VGGGGQFSGFLEFFEDEVEYCGGGCAYAIGVASEDCQLNSYEEET